MLVSSPGFPRESKLLLKTLKKGKQVRSGRLWRPVHRPHMGMLSLPEALLVTKKVVKSEPDLPSRLPAYYGIKQHYP